MRTIDKIYQEAYKLFISKPYESVTVRDIEKATGMTRGAVFYYVKDKEQLFREVLDKYFLTTQNIFVRVGEDILKRDITLKQFIKLMALGTEVTIDNLYQLADIDKYKSDKSIISKADRLYIGLILYAGYYLEDFTIKMDNLFDEERKTWKFFIQKGIDNGEIKPNTNVELFGEMFSCVRTGKAFQDSLNEGINVNGLEQLYMELFNIIKL